MRPLSALLAVLGAAAVGAAFGVMYAPRKGSETRHNMLGYMRRHCNCFNDPRLHTLADKLACELNNEE